MKEGMRLSSAIAWSALLHVGLLVFLLLTTLSCNHFERAFAWLHLPEQWNPVRCDEPLSMRGPVIQATLVGETSMAVPQAPEAVDVETEQAPVKAPEPTKQEPEKEAPKKPDQPEKVADAPKTEPVKVAKEEPKVEAPQPQKTKEADSKPEVKPVDSLPAPVKDPANKEQEKVVAKADEKAKQAEKEQEEKRKQKMAELEAQKQAKLEAQKKAEQDARQKQIDDLLNELDMASSSASEASKKSAEAAKELAEAKAKQTESQSNSSQNSAKQTQTGNNGSDTDAYKAALQNAITRAWLRPDDLPVGASCTVHIQQIPGGQVTDVAIDPSCPLDTVGKRSVKNAVLRAEPLPYKGFESAFQRRVTLNFKIED